MPEPRPHKEPQAGQVLALFAFGFMALVAAAAFVIDGGNAYANHRISQNASDAAAEAGAVVLAENLSGATRTDNDVRGAVDGVLAAMEMDVVSSKAEYTDIDGNTLNVPVGSLGGARPPSAAWGVAVNGDRDFGTFFARILGMDQFTATTHATAITGYGQPVPGVLLPVTPPINILTCDGQNNPAFALPLNHWNGYELYRVPLCKNGPGNVGWIDWTPPAGGIKELEQEILNPTGEVTVPSWNYVTQTGNTAAGQVEDALRTYDGTVVYIPIFDSTCNTDPTPGVTTVDGCPLGHEGGTGQQQWYHLQEIGAFQFCPGNVSSDEPVEIEFVTACATAGISYGSYINGTNTAECDSGNGGTKCLIGRWVNFIGPGTVSGEQPGTDGPSKGVVVQLIK